VRKALAAVLCCVPPFALAQAGAPAEDPLAHLGWLRDLAGACWQGTDSAGRATDRQCYEIQFGRFLRGTIEIGAADNKPPGFRGDSLFHRDRRPGTVAVVMWGSNGLVNVGEARLEGESIRFLQPRIEGRPGQRTSWTRQGADAFRVAREQREGEGWKETLVVNYRRVAK
jgi:hypothetical protein